MRKACLFYPVILSLALAAGAQNFFDNYVYQQWNSFGGLTGATATDIIQTEDGFINIGTYEGLVRFDGVEFTTLKRSRHNDYTFASVRNVMEDHRGCLWIGANDEGVQVIQPEGNKTFTTQNGLPNNSVRAMVEDKAGNVWVGTAAGVVYMTPTHHLLTPQFEAGTISKGVISTGLFCDSDGRVWLTTENDNGLFVFKDGLFHAISAMAPFEPFQATAVCQDSNGIVWVGTDTVGIVKIENNKAQQIRTGTILDTVTTSTIYESPDGNIWFGTNSGLAVYSGGKFYVCPKENVRNAKVNKIIQDREGNIWIATDRNGIGKLTHGMFKMTKSDGASNAIAEGLDGRVWIGTDKGVLCYKDESEAPNALTEFTKDLRIRDVSIAQNGDILVSCYKKPALLRYDIRTEKITNWSTDEGLVGNKVRVAVETAPNELYVGTTTGLSIIHEDGSINNFKQPQGLVNEYVMCIHKDKDGLIWIGTDGGGVYFMRNEHILGHLTSDQGLIGNVIFKISQTSDGSHWICTGNGITRCPPYDSSKEDLPDVFQNITSDNGLRTNSVFQMVEDNSDLMWLISNYGIASVPLDELVDVAEGEKEQVTVNLYTKNDGLDSDGPTSTAKSILDSKGRLWFTMVDGFSVYDPEKVHTTSVLPLVCIESIKVDNVEYKTLNQTLELKPGTKRVEIKFTGLSFDAPDRIQFTHRLASFENEFTEPDYARTVSYTNLHPGKYTFMVSAINEEGLVSESGKTMLFVQKPHFYQTTWFWSLFTLIFLGSIFTIFFLRERAIQMENLRLENLVKQRTSQLEQEKEKSDNLLRAILPDKIAMELKDGIRAVGDNFDDVTMLFSDIVNFTKTSSGHTASEIVHALNDLFSRFDERAKRMGVEKIKTIGDAYMAGCGFPMLNENHARIMVEFAKGMYEDLDEYNSTAKIKFNIRIGLNSGPVSAGVIGKTKFIYDVWGNTVNVASRMESAATPGGIRVSEAVYNHLKGTDVVFSAPIECDIKGKGLMTTYDIITEEQR